MARCRGAAARERGHSSAAALLLVLLVLLVLRQSRATCDTRCLAPEWPTTLCRGNAVHRPLC